MLLSKEKIAMNVLRCRLKKSIKEYEHSVGEKVKVIHFERYKEIGYQGKVKNRLNVYK